MGTFSNFLTPAICFLVTVVFGFWLSRIGKPYNGILFNIHKLVALGAVIVTAMRIYNGLKVMEHHSLLIVSIVIAVIGVIALFASGAFLSIGNLNYQTMKTIHNIAPFVAVIGMAAAIYLLAVQLQ